MMSEQVYGPFGLSYEEEEMRLHNIEVCGRYLDVKGPGRNVQRMEFCTDEGIMYLPFSFGRDPRDEEANKVKLSFKKLGEKYEANGFDWFRDWRLSNGVIYTTEDPDFQFIECDGQSMRFDDRFEDIGYYQNHYLLPIVFKDGKVDKVYEIMNTYAVYENYGWNKEPRLF